MKEINSDELMQVLGGARAVAAARSRSDEQLQLAMLKMQSDLRDLREPQNNQMAMMTFAIAAMAMNRNRFA